MTQFIRCKICDEKVTEGEQASIVHDKCQVPKEDYEEIKDMFEGAENQAGKFEEKYQDVDTILDKVNGLLLRLSKNALKPDLERFVKDLREILEDYEG